MRDCSSVAGCKGLGCRCLLCAGGRSMSVQRMTQLGDQAGIAGRVVHKVGGLLLQLLSDNFSWMHQLIMN